MATYTIPQRFRHMSGTYTELYSRNRLLLAGEECFETHDEAGVEHEPWLCKVGDGVTYWNDLEYQSSGGGGGSLTDTDDLTEGATNLYFTDERAQDAVAAALAAGSHSGITVNYDDASNAIDLTVSGGSGGDFTYVNDATVAGSAATVVTMSGLDLTTDGCYDFICVFKSAVGSNANISLYYNSDTTATNYYVRRLLLSGSTVSTGNPENSGFCFGLQASTTTVVTGRIFKDSDGNASAFLQSREGVTSSTIGRSAFHRWTTSTNVTGITFSTSVASGLAIGSYFRVWKATT